jgi:hypothetical protein
MGLKLQVKSVSRTSLTVAGAMVLLAAATYATCRRSSALQWHRDPQIGAVLLDHLQQQRQSLRHAPMDVVLFDLNFDATAAPSCGALRAMAGGLGGRSQDEWFSVVSHGQETALCALSNNSSPSDHKIWFADVASLGRILEAIAPHPTPTCRDCASRLLVVHSHKLDQLETAMGDLLDKDMRWQILRDITNSTHGGSWFALRQQPLPIQEQRFLNDFNVLQTSAAPCEEQKFVVWEFIGTGLGSVMSVMALVTRYSVYAGRTLIIMPTGSP